MKKVLSIILSILLVFTLVFFVVSCNKVKTKGEVSIYVPDGLPALAIAQLMHEKPTYKEYNISYHIVAGAAEISAAMASGNADIAIVPTNIASTLYNKVNAKLLSTNSQGSLYMVGKTAVSSLMELKGKVVYNIGAGGTPDLTFKYLLNKANIPFQISETADASGEKVSLHYVSNGSELIPLLKTGVAQFGILGEPAVSQAINAAGVTRVFDIKELYKTASGNNGGYPQASLVIAKSLQSAEEKDFLKWFLDKVIANDTWVAANPQQAQAALKANGSTLTAPFTTDIIQKCNIQTILAKNAKADVNSYLKMVFDLNPQAVGMALPNDDFFYDLNA